ncbi:MAG TPA: FecR family protein [Verrucomicrobiae bacterium]|nr:FecR family protein [Verrucomicrobiae bacterium]
MSRRCTVPFLVFFGVALGLFSMGLQMSASADETGLSYARIVRLSVVRGDVQIARAGTGKWEPAALNMPLQQGFAVGTNEGMAEIELEHGSMIWVAPDSVVQFTELALSDGGQITKVAMTNGTATYDASINSHDVFLVSNPNFQITPEGKSEFRLDLTKDGAGVTVLKGRVSFQSAKGTEELAKGEMYFLGVRKPQETQARPAPKKDEWDKFVDERSGYLEAAAAKTNAYTNAPFSYGMADLSSYGGWTFIPGIGFAWQPDGISSGWMPFSDGSMMYYDGFGWTWVSAEPWGWVPYHFGQWSYAGSNGWVWVPGNYSQWSPAPVHWVAEGNKIGWTPLAEVKNATEHKTPMVVLANKGLANFDSYKLIKSVKEGQTVQMLAASPGESGKLGTTNEMRLVAPTTVGLASLPRGISEETLKAPLGRPAISRPPMEAMEVPHAFSMRNGMAAPSMINSRPPTRMMGFGMGQAPVAGAEFGGRAPGAMMGASNEPIIHAGSANGSSGAKPR